MNTLQKLIGQKVLHSDMEDGVASFELSDAEFIAYNPVEGAAPKECVGTNILAVQLIAKERLVLTFSHGLTLNISL